MVWRPALLGRMAIAALFVVLGTGQVWGQSTTPAEAPDEVRDSSPVSIRFSFKDAPLDQVIDFFARETGLPVIREADLPAGAVTFLSAESYPLEEAMRILNTILQTRGIMLRRDKEFLYLQRLDQMQAEAVPTFPGGELPAEMTEDQIISIVLPLNNATAKAIEEQLKPLVAPYGSLVALPQQNAVIVTETVAQCRRLQSIIDMLDAKPAYQESVRVFPLRHIKAADALTSLKVLVAEKQTTVVIDEKGNRKTISEDNMPGVRMEADMRTNSIIVLGAEGRLETIQQLVQLLDVPETPGTQQEMVTVALNAIPADQAASHVRALFSGDPPEQRPTLVPLPTVGKLAIVGSVAAITQAQTLLREIDGWDADEQRLERTGLVLPVRHVHPETAIGVLSQLMTPRQQQVLRLAPSPGGQAIVAAGPAADLERIGELLDAIDSENPQTKDVRVLELSRNLTVDAIDRAMTIYEQTGKAPIEPVSVSVDTETATVLVIASPDALNRYTDILGKVGEQIPINRETRTYDVRQAAASDVAGQLIRLARPLLTTADPNEFIEPQIEAVDELDLVIVRALPEQFGVLEQVLETLDSPEPSRLQFRVMELTTPNPAAVAKRSLEIYHELTAELDKEEAGIVEYEIDESTGKLLITADETGMQRFTQILRDVQQLTPPERSSRLIDLQLAKASDVVPQLRTLLESTPIPSVNRPLKDPVIQVIEETNSLLVTAEELQHQIVEGYVRKLDVLEPTDLPPLKLIQVRAADATSLARMLTDQYDRRPQNERREMPVDIRADAATNTLIISAHEDLYAEIQSFVDDINRASSEDTDRITEIFPLKVAKAVDVAAAMDKLFPLPPVPLDRRGRPMPWLQEQREVQITADPASNALIVDAPAERMSDFAALVEKLDRVELPPQAQLRTYRVVNADLNAIVRTLQSLNQQGSLGGQAEAGRPRVQVTIEAEPKSGTLIVAGDEMTHERVEQVLKDLSAVPLERELRVVRIANADPREIADKAQEIYEQQTEEVPGAQPVDVSIDAATTSLMIVAEAEAMTRFMRILDELESQAGPPRELRLIELQHADAMDVQEFLNDLLESSRPFSTASGVDPVFEPIERNNTILVAAQPDQHAIIDSLIRSIDQPGDANAGPLRILRLRAAEAENIAQVLTQAYSQRPTEDRAARPVNIRADPSTNTLIVSAHPEMLPEVERIVSELNDAQAYDSEGREIRIFPLQVARAEELARTLDQMFPDPPVPLDRRGRPMLNLQEPREVVVRADRQTNSIIVDAPAKRMAGFEQLVNQLDRAEVRDDVEVRTYQLERADLDAVAGTLRRLASSGGINTGQGGARAAQIIIEAEPMTRTLVISGPTQSFDDIEHVLSELDGGHDRPESQLLFFSLTSARADRIEPVVERMLTARLREHLEREGGRPDEAQAMLDIAADQATNSIILSVPEPIVAEARELIARLDSGQAAGREIVRVVPLTFADAPSTASALQQSLSESAALPSAGRITISAAGGSNALVVSGAEVDVEFVQQLVAELDSRPTRENVGVRTIFLQHARAENIAPLVEQLLQGERLSEWVRMNLLMRRGEVEEGPDVRVAADARINAVIVTAPPEVLTVAEELVRQLDVETGDRIALDRPVHIITLINADAREVAANLDAVFGEVTDGIDPAPVIRVDQSSNSLLIRATPAQLETVEALTERLDRAALTSSRQMRLIPVDRSRMDAAVMAETLRRMLESRGGVSVEVIDASELAGPEEADAEEPVSLQIDDLKQPPEDVELARRGVLLSKPVKLILGYTQIAVAALPAAPESDIAPQDQDDVIDAELTIAVDPTTNSLIVVGSARATERLAELAAMLERQLPAEPGRVRVITLPDDVDARSVANLVNATIRSLGQASPDQPGGMTGRASIIPDPAGGALVVSSNDTDFKVIGELISALSRPGVRDEFTVKIYPLSTISADRAQRAVTDLFSASPTGRQARRLRGGEELQITLEDDAGAQQQVRVPVGGVRVSAGPEGASLIVAAPPEALPLVDRFIEMIDQSPMAGQQVIRSYTLTNAEAAGVAQTLQGIFDAARQTLGGRTARARFLPDVRTNTVLVTASDDDHAEAMRLIAELDVRVEDEAGELAIIPLQVATPSSVEQIIDQLVIGRDSARQDRISVTSEDNMGLLLVRAPDEELQQINQIIAEVDRPDAAEQPVHAFKLERADAAAVARSLQQFFDDRARASTRPGQRPKPRRVAIIGDQRSSTVIVAAGEEDYAQIASLIETFDAPAEARDLKFKVIQLEHVRASEIEDTLFNLSGDLQWLNSMFSRGREAVQDKITLQSDTRTNTIIVMGQGESFDTIEAIVRALDVPRPEGARVGLRVFQVQQADLDVLRRALEQAFTDPNQSRRWWEPADPQALRFEVDARSRSIIVIGPEQEFDAVGAMINDFDLAFEGEERVIETLTLAHADATQAAASLNRFFNDRARLEGIGQSPVSITGSRDGNTLIVMAPRGDMALVQDILARLDQPDLQQDRRIEIFALEHGRAQDVSQTVSRLFPSGRGGQGGVTSTPDVRTNSVVVSAPTELYAQVEALIRQMDAPPAGDTMFLRTFALDSARAEEVARTLTDALKLNDDATGRARALQGNVRKFLNEQGEAVEVKASITPDRRSNTLIVSADDKSMSLVSQLIAELDGQPAVSETEYRVVALDHAVASEVARTLQSLLRRRPSSGDPEPSVTSSSRDNTLIIAATADQHAEINRILEEIDVPSRSKRITEFVPLSHADAEQAQEALGVFYGRFAFEAETPGARNVSIVADPATNSLVISADEAEWEGIRELLTKLDSQEYDASRQLEVVPLQHADASSVASALQQAFEAPLRAELERERQERRDEARRRGGRVDEFLFDAPSVLVDDKEVVSVSAEPITNSLIISAGRQDLDRIKSIIAKLDVPEFANLDAPRIIALDGGRATSVAQTLRQMFERSTGGRTNRTASRSLAIVGDDASNVLLVRASDEEFAQIKALAEALQQEGELARVSVRVLPLFRQPASRMAQTVLATFASAAQQDGAPLSVEADRRTNALVIASSKRIYDEIEQVVRELDGPAPDAAGEGETQLPPGLPGQGLFIIDVSHTSPQEIQRLLEQLGVTRPQPDDRPGLVSEPITVIPLTTRRSVAVLTSPGDGQSIVQLVSALDAEPVFPDQHVAILPLSVANAANVAATLESMLAATGTASTTKLAESISEQVRRLNLRGERIGDRDIELDLTVPIRIQAEPQTNAIIVASTPANIGAMEQLVPMLDRLPIGDAVVIRIFHLNNTAAARASSVIKELFSQGESLRRAPGSEVRGLPTTETGRALAGEVAVSVDDRTNALIVAGREEAVALVEVLIGEMDSSETANWVEPRLITLKFADAARLAETLNEVIVKGTGNLPDAQAIQRQVGRLRMLREKPDGKPTDKSVESTLFAPMTRLTIIPEEQLNSLIIVGATANVEIVEELVRMLDVKGASRADMVRLYPLRFAAADRVADLIRRLFQDQVRSGAIREEDDVTVQADVRTNTLVIATSPRSFAVIDNLLRTMDAEGVHATVGVHVIPIEKNDARQLAPKIERLMRERLNAMSADVRSERDVVSIQADEATNSLIVAASDENLQLIRELVDLLAREDGLESQLEVFGLKSARASDMVTLLNELYVREITRTRGEGSIRLRADDRLNAVIVNGTGEDIQQIRELIERLDAPSLGAVREIRIIELQSANALEMVNLIENVLAGRSVVGSRGSDRQATLLRYVQKREEERLAAEGEAAPTETEVSAAIREQISLTPDLRTNSVIISAPPTLMVMIETLIDDLDSSASGSRQIAVYALENADAEQMAELLRDLFNLRQQGNLYVLVPHAQVDEESTEEFANQLGFGDMALTVVPDERQQLAITIDARTNSLLVSGTPTYLELVDEVVNRLDGEVGTERVQMTYELKNARVDEVADAMQAFINQEQDRIARLLGPDRTGSLIRRLENEISVVGVPGSSRLILSASPRYIDKVLSLVEELDRAPAQVLIQVLLAEVTLDSEQSWGVDFTLFPQGSRMLEGSLRAGGAGVLTALGVPNISVSTLDFNLLIRALDVQGRLEVLSRPQILVNDNEDARIQVGEEIQLVTNVERLDNGNTRSDVTPREIGVILVVTPSISPDGFVRLDIAPEISQLSARTTQISEDFEAPVITQRRADTTVTVRDGQTIVIGGLIQNQAETRTQKVPLLGDIPILGIPFRTELTRSTKTELLIILTPRVILSDSDLRDISLDEIDRLSLPVDLKDVLRTNDLRGNSVGIGGFENGEDDTEDAVPARSAESYEEWPTP